MLALAEYWADSGAARLAPGGSIQRIGYDAGAFDEAFRVVCGGEAPGDEGQRVEGAVGVIPAGAGAGAGEGAAQEGKEAAEGKEKEGGEGYKTNKEDLAVIVRRLSFPPSSQRRTRSALSGRGGPAPLAALSKAPLRLADSEPLAAQLDNLDVPSALASHTLRAHKGDLAATLADLSAPRAPAAASSA